MKTRKSNFELLRIFACLSVVSIHYSMLIYTKLPVDTLNWISSSIAIAIGHIAVPIFFALNGAFLLSKSNFPSLKKLYTGSILKYLILYLLWGVIFTFVFLIAKWLGIQGDFNAGLTSANAIVNSITEHAPWFLIALCGIYAVSPFLKLIVDSGKKNIEYFLLLSFVCGCLLPFLSEYTAIPWLEQIYLTMRLFFGYALYTMLGYYLYTYPPQKTLWRKTLFYSGFILLLIRCMIWVIYPNFFGERILTSINEGAYLWPDIPIIVLSFFDLFCYKVPEQIGGEQTTRRINRLASYTLGVYLIHPLVQYVFMALNILPDRFPSIFFIPIMTIVIFIISALIVFIMKKIPLIRKLIS